jgi:hypothetical protein
VKVIEEGHIYELDTQDRDDPEVLTFVNREDTPHGGTQTQEVIRALIDRTMHCDNCLRWEGNDLVIYHLRMALVMHESRALARKVHKGIMKPEDVITDRDGHFAVEEDVPSTDRLVWEGATRFTSSEGGLGKPREE